MLRKILFVLMLATPAFSVMIQSNDPIPRCFPCPPQPPPAW
ncbi:MAG TPA: hypothetical protein PKJ41_18220 [Bryobacteraceae bacterium]|nr:hypothetical protein [Bryobacteraceae bacterium]HPT28060.1 hypothetical protein [Bryobacteraceae bacterium]